MTKPVWVNRISVWWLLAIALLLATATGAMASKRSYDLQADSVVEGVWVVSGSTENFSKANGGNILNTGFIETGAGVVVIDTGPSRQYGEEFRALIERHTNEPIKKVLVTHHHPDHAFGSQAFELGTLYMLDGSAALLERDGDAFSDNMYRMTGSWMRGTEVTVPGQRVEPGILQIGDRTLRLIAMQGHTGADLVVLDETSGVLFASDVVFFNRALTTPQTPGLQAWASDVRELAKLPFSILVPGHGPLVEDDRAFEQMLDYLAWLDDLLYASASRGLSAVEVARTEIPERFAEVEGAGYELIRTVSHLYPGYEKQALATSSDRNGQ